MLLRYRISHVTYDVPRYGEVSAGRRLAERALGTQKTPEDPIRDKSFGKMKFSRDAGACCLFNTDDSASLRCCGERLSLTIDCISESKGKAYLAFDKSHRFDPKEQFFHPKLQIQISFPSLHCSLYEVQVVIFLASKSDIKHPK